MNEPLFDQLSARERRIIRKSLDPDVRLFYRSPQNSPRNHFRTTKDISEQNTLQKTQNEEEKESKSENENENDLKSENNEKESKSENNEIENNNENKEQAEGKNPEEEELKENESNNEQNNEQTTQNNENSLNNQLANSDDEEDILTRKLNEMSIKHSIQQKILIHEAEIDLKKSNYSPVSLRSFIIKTSNIKQRQQNEKMRILEKYGSAYKVNRQLTQRSLRSKSERNIGNQNKYRSSHGLNLTPRLAMFALDKRTSSPNPRFSAPATLAREQEQLDVTERIKLPSISQSQQISNHIPLFDTESEKVYHSEKVFRLNDPFSNFLSSQELVSSPSIKLNVKPPPPPAKNAASPRKSGKKTARSSRMSRKKGKSSLSTVTQEAQEPQEPPPPPIKRHVLTMRASLIPKSGIIDVDKRDFLEFLYDKEEDIPVEVIEENHEEEDDKSSTKRSKSKNKKSRSSSKMKSRASTKSKVSSKK